MKRQFSGLWGEEMPVLVMKFGGTSVANLERIRNAAEKVQREVARGYEVIVIVSAMWQDQ